MQGRLQLLFNQDVNVLGWELASKVLCRWCRTWIAFGRRKRQTGQARATWTPSSNGAPASLPSSAPSSSASCLPSLTRSGHKIVWINQTSMYQWVVLLLPLVWPFEAIKAPCQPSTLSSTQ